MVKSGFEFSLKPLRCTDIVLILQVKDLGLQGMHNLLKVALLVPGKARGSDLCLSLLNLYNTNAGL